ncbi:hypothetical protein, conserved [Entamoeba dispar SAW760]|uniref:small monomeric GTPase n=1 Tax=Entamoeba dispar (strain ATCC PRA-260 / SAW760) TaxID=370354 RepID=B0EDF7_ENTDS|nr:uncharacterized protein EDI_093650 [Entamoeba dispar SAW760]EDR27574.1 hypothetical protein, conserved [Entamoeba dispar SAW760]|eukprot:EDR27574.1 hypothetical protein, conserved [Entamoeba dispar SAW760]
MNLAKEFKVAVIGDLGVGKTSLLMTQKIQSYEEKFGNGEINYSFEFEINKLPILLKVWEVDCSESYDEFRPLSYRDTDCFVIVFSYIDKDSLVHAERKWLREVKNNVTDPIVVFVMTKVDLKSDQNLEDITTEKKIVTEDLLESFKLRSESHFLYECSAKQVGDVRLLWNKIAEIICDSKKTKRKRKLSTSEKIKSLFI